MWASPHEKKELERGRTWNCYACVSFRIMFMLCIIGIVMHACHLELCLCCASFGVVVCE